MVVVGAQRARRIVTETTPLRDSKSNGASNPEVSLTVRDGEKLRSSLDRFKMTGNRLRGTVR